jgi:DNA-binding GntR family transcriptional regulator
MAGSADRLGDLKTSSAGASRQQLSEEVASYVRELILSGQVKQGDFLRLEPIAEALGVSNTPVREGLLSLRGEGFVALVPRRGFVVGSFTRQDVEDIFWAQAMIGSELAARAATKISKDGLRRLQETQELHDKAVKDADPANIAKLGHEFHRVINLAAGSPRLATLMGTTAAYLPNRFYATVDAQVQSTLHAHPAILEALQRGNAHSARAQMRDHILAGGENLIADLASRGVWGEPSEAAS